MGLALLDPAIWPQYTVYRAATNIIYVNGIAQTENNDPEYVAILIKARVRAGLGGKVSKKRNRDLEGKNTEGRIVIYTKNDDSGIDERLLSDRNNPNILRGDIFQIENEFYKVNEVTQIPNLSTLSSTVKHYKAVGYLMKDFQAPEVDPVEPFLPPLVLAANEVCFTADVPADTVITVDSSGASWIFSGDVISMGASETAFNNDKGLWIIRDGAIETKKGDSVFWVSPNQIKFNFKFNAGRSVLIKKFNV